MPTAPLNSSSREMLIRGKVGVGRYLAGLRTELGLTVAEAAAMVGLSGGMVSQIEMGYASLPSLRAMDFAMAYGVDPLDLGLVVFSLNDPHLFAMIFQNAIVEPLEVPREDRMRAEATLARQAHRRELMRRKEAKKPRQATAR